MTLGGGELTVIGGPCVAESLDLCLRTGEELQRICSRLGLGYVFKTSFDKANRTSGVAARGPGLDEGIELFQAIKDRLGIGVTTDIHIPEQAALVAPVIDLIQIPAYLCRQTDLLKAAAETGRPVNVKKGQFLAPQDTKNIVEKLKSYQAQGILLTERGVTFGYNSLVVDMPGLEIMRGFGVPVCFDATHSAQRPGGTGAGTAGVRDSVPAMARAAVAVGIDAIFLEVHPEPERALSDSATQWRLSDAQALLQQVKTIHEARRSIGG